MSRKAGKVPSYFFHKHSGQAVVRVESAGHYLGPYGSAESHELYQRLITDWRVERQEKPAPAAARLRPFRTTILVDHVLGLYWQFAKG